MVRLSSLCRAPGTSTTPPSSTRRSISAQRNNTSTLFWALTNELMLKRKSAKSDRARTGKFWLLSLPKNIFLAQSSSKLSKFCFSNALLRRRAMSTSFSRPKFQSLLREVLFMTSSCLMRYLRSKFRIYSLCTKLSWRSSLHLRIKLWDSLNSEQNWSRSLSRYWRSIWVTRRWRCKCSVCLISSRWRIIWSATWHQARWTHYCL